MLKIKDYVDLKELEKFGFVRDVEGYSFFDGHTDYRLHIYIDDMRCFCFVFVPYYVPFVDIPDVLYDLIQAGLVEKECKYEIK